MTTRRRQVVCSNGSYQVGTPKPDAQTLLTHQTSLFCSALLQGRPLALEVGRRAGILSQRAQRVVQAGLHGSERDRQGIGDFL